VGLRVVHTSLRTPASFLGVRNRGLQHGTHTHTSNSITAVRSSRGFLDAATSWLVSGAFDEVRKEDAAPTLRLFSQMLAGLS